MKSHLINYAKGLVGQYYQTEGNKKLVIYLTGAPTLPSDKTKDAELLTKQWFDLVVPDYYGYARSAGVFSTKNCIQTVYDTIQIFDQQMSIISVYSDNDLILPKYDEIILIGSSYWWRITAIVPKYEKIIKEIVLLYPALDRLDRNEHGHKESTDEDFLREYLLWYKNLYRFVEWIDPYDAMLEIEEFDSTKNSSHLRDVKVFVWHGSADDVIWCGRSKIFVDQLKDMHPDGYYHYAEYYGLWHGWICKEAALRWRIHRRKQFES